MEHASKALWNALRRVARPERPLDLLAAMWPVLVGQRLAAHTRPVNWNKGRLDIAVSDPEWHQQLASLKGEIKRQVNRWWGTELVSEVRLLEVRANRKPSREAGRGKKAIKPGPSRESARTASAAKLASGEFKETLQALEAVLARIPEAELRKLIEQVARKYLARGGKK
jgi:hypothetical protein